MGVVKTKNFTQHLELYRNSRYNYYMVKMDLIYKGEFHVKKRVPLSIICLALCVGIMSTGMNAQAVNTGGNSNYDSSFENIGLSAQANISYIDENNEPATLTEPYTTVTDTTTKWEDGWYVVNGYVEITDTVTVTGDVKLILSDDAQLNTKNISVNQGNTFSVYCQSGGTGSLTAKSSSNVSPGIGASRYNNGGNINIYGGIIYSQGGKEGAGIGGSASCSHGGTVKIYGGTVTAVGGNLDGAGIGGGGWDQSYDKGPYGGNGADVYIYGGNVTSIGGGNAPSIGAGGSSNSHGSFSTGENGHAVIFANAIRDRSKKSQWSGIIFEGNSGTVYNDQTLTENLTIDSGKTLNIPENTCLTVSEGVNLTNKGTIFCNGTIVNNGILTNNSTIRYKVTTKLTDLTADGGSYATQGTDYTTTLTAAEGYVLPQSITVTVGGTTLTAGENTYSYDSATGKLTIDKAAITGAITITAAAAIVINEVNVTITLPKGEQPLGTDAICETAGIKSVTLYWTDTENNPVSGNANYYPWCYKAHMTITPMEGYILTDSTNVSVNNKSVEEKTLNTDGTLKVANPYYSNQVKLISITQPEGITGVSSGTEKTATALGLPSTVTIATETTSIHSAVVTWDLDNLVTGSYDPAKLTEQTFRVKGTVSLPEEIDNSDNISLEITIDVTVAAHRCTAIGDWQYDNDGHWKNCSCGAKIGAEAHSGGTATCTKQAVCSVCGSMYGEPLGHDWTISYEWSEDGRSCTAIHTCRIDANHKETANATVNGEKTKAADCTEMGETTYTATFAVSWASKQAKTVADIPATGHRLTKTEAKVASCTEAGNTEYWTCGTCSKVFSDENGTKEIALDSIVIQANGHSYVDGKCTVCGAIDSSFKTVITADTNGTWQQGSKDGLSFTINVAYDDFPKIQVDGKDLDATNYTVKKGSNIITLNASYLETLSVGKHTLTVVSDAVTVSTEFTINQLTSPQTGDNSNMQLWIALLLASGAGLTISVMVNKKRHCAK